MSTIAADPVTPSRRAKRGEDEKPITLKEIKELHPNEPGQRVYRIARGHCTSYPGRKYLPQGILGFTKAGAAPNGRHVRQVHRVKFELTVRERIWLEPAIEHFIRREVGHDVLIPH